MVKKATKEQTKRERDSAKLKRVLISKGYPSGKAPKGKVAHHVKPVAEGGKTRRKNIRVISTARHIKIHKNRRKQGKI
ncbi:MAG TPA: HNH endonuclease signature motif containing protein [Patescibacteria group bacterium]|nr:HNH endonuclease signature motif containing protein [Patescibacteria group bacterium]